MSKIICGNKSVCYKLMNSDKFQIVERNDLITKFLNQPLNIHDTTKGGIIYR
jgi:hypothetical protein